MIEKDRRIQVNISLQFKQFLDMYKHHPNIHSHIHNTQYLILCIQIYRHFLILRLKLQKYLIECLNINSLMNKVRSTGNYSKWPIKRPGRLFSNKNVWVGACLDYAFNWTYELIKKNKNQNQKTTKSVSQVNFSRNSFQNWSQKSFYSFRLNQLQLLTGCLNGCLANYMKFIPQNWALDQSFTVCIIWKLIISESIKPN